MEAYLHATVVETDSHAEVAVDPSRSIAHTVLKTRRALRLTQHQFGQLINARWETISRWENGHLVPDVWQQNMIRCLWTAAGCQPNTAQIKELLEDNETGHALATALSVIPKHRW